MHNIRTYLQRKHRHHMAVVALRPAGAAHHHRTLLAQKLGLLVRVPFAHLWLHVDRLPNGQQRQLAGHQLVLAKHPAGGVQDGKAGGAQWHAAVVALQLRLDDGAFGTVAKFGLLKGIGTGAQSVGPLKRIGQRRGGQVREAAEVRLHVELGPDVTVWIN